MPEVQEAMASQLDSLMKNKDEWMTPELTEKIASHPFLSKALANPECAAALNEFQSNPAQAAAKYGHIPAINEVFKQVLQLLFFLFAELVTLFSHFSS